MWLTSCWSLQCKMIGTVTLFPACEGSLGIRLIQHLSGSCELPHWVPVSCYPPKVTFLMYFNTSGKFQQAGYLGSSRVPGMLWFLGKRGPCYTGLASGLQGRWTCSSAARLSPWDLGTLAVQMRRSCPGRSDKGLLWWYLYPKMLSFHASFNLDKLIYCSKIS